MQLLADLDDCSVFSVISGKKQYHTPTEFGFCLKVPLSLWPCSQRGPHWPLWNSNCAFSLAGCFFLKPVTCFHTGSIHPCKEISCV